MIWAVLILAEMYVMAGLQAKKVLVVASNKRRISWSASDKRRFHTWPLIWASSLDWPLYWFLWFSLI
jgi:hypothetical protein